MEYQLTNEADVRLEIYNAIGIRLMNQTHQNESVGKQRHIVNLQEAVPGIYFIKVFENDVFIKGIKAIKKD